MTGFPIRMATALCAALLAGCQGGEGGIPSFGSSVASVETEGGPADLLATSPVAGAPPGALILEALIEPSAALAVGFEVPGRVDAVHVGPGDVVQEGQVLASLDMEERRVRLDEATRRWNEARSALPAQEDNTGRPDSQLVAEMEDRLARVREAAARSPGDLETVRAAVEREGQEAASNQAIAIHQRRGSKPSSDVIRRSHQNSMARALADELGQRVSQLESALEASVLRAPTAGTVAKVSIRVGVEWNTRGAEPAIELVDDRYYRLRASMDTARALRLTADEPIWCELSGRAGVRVVGCRVTRVSETEHEDQSEGTPRRLREVSFTFVDPNVGEISIGDPVRIALAP